MMLRVVSKNRPVSQRIGRASQTQVIIINIDCFLIERIGDFPQIVELIVNKLDRVPARVY